MKEGFQTVADFHGNLHVRAGTVLQVSTGVVFRVGGGGSGFLATDVSPAGSEYQPATQPTGAAFVGGSGRNLWVSGLPASSSGMVPGGWMLPAGPGEFTVGDFVLSVTDIDDASLSDGTDVVAVWASGADAPAGNYESTTYGADTYNSGTAFVLAVEAEDGAPGVIPSGLAAPNAGTAPGGIYTTADGGLTFDLDDHPGWMAIVAADGTAEITDGVDIVATRSTGTPGDVAGVYLATAYGELTYHPTTEPDPDPVDPDPDPDPAVTDPLTPDPGSDPTDETDPDVLNPESDPPPDDPAPDPDPDPEPPAWEPTGQPWQMVIELIPVMPRAGYVYLKLTTAAGEIVGVEAPRFGDMPDNTATEFFVPVAVSDGMGGVEQIVSGTLVWDPPLEVPTIQRRVSTEDATATAHTTTPSATPGLTGLILQPNTLYRLTLHGRFSAPAGGSVQPVLRFTDAQIKGHVAATWGPGIFRIFGTIGGPYVNTSRAVQLVYRVGAYTSTPAMAEFYFETDDVPGTAFVGFAQWNGGVSGTATMHAGARVILEKLT
jgi:hypothetical protein